MVDFSSPHDLRVDSDHDREHRLEIPQATDPTPLVLNPGLKLYWLVAVVLPLLSHFTVRMPICLFGPSLPI